MFRFSIVVLVLAVIIIGTLIGGERLQWWVVPSFAFAIVSVMAVFTLVLYAYLLQIRKVNPGMFSMFYLLSIAIKLMGGLGAIGVIFWLDQSSAFAHGVIFLAVYLMFTVLEVAFLLRKS